MTALVEIDVLVVCQHNAEMVSRCLASCKEGAHHKANLHVYQNGTGQGGMDDDLYRTIGALYHNWGGFTWLLPNDGKNAGFIRPNNDLAKEGTAPYICLLNADTICAPGWDVPLVEALNTGGVNPLAFPALLPSPGVVGYGGALLGRDMVGIMQGHGTAVDYIEGLCLMTTRAVWEALGGFDEEHLTLAYGEDSDLCLRAKEAGYGVMAVPNQMPQEPIETPASLGGGYIQPVVPYVKHLGSQGATEATQKSAELQAAFQANHTYLRERHKAYLERDRVLVKGYKRPYLRVKTVGGGTDYTAQPALAASLIGPDTTAEHVNVFEVDGRLWQINAAGQFMRFLLP